MATPKDTMRKEWIIPPGLNTALENFKAVCDVFFEEDEDNQKTRPIMICGPTGVGKSCFTDYFIGRYFAKYPKKKAKLPIVKINCAAIPETLIESDLFGHKKGAFTGATENKSGHFDSTEKLIVLEEIGELPKPLQAKLLVVIENRTFFQVGSTKKELFNGQIIATTNRTKEDFRTDFFYRFFPFYIPGIHERRSDILYYLHSFDKEILRHLTKENILTLLSYHWPGNVREIQLFSRLLKINKIRFGEHINVSDLFENLPEDIFDEGEKISFIDDGKQLFQIDQNYTEFDINKHLYFLKNLFEGCDKDRFAAVQRIEESLDDCIGLSETDSPFPISKDIKLIQHQVFHFPIKEESSNKNLYTIEHFFIAVENEDINKISDAFDQFCLFFFRNPKAGYDLLTFTNFTIPIIEFNSKRLEKKFTGFDEKKLSEISLDILSLFSKKKGFGKNKYLPLGYTERKEKIKKLHEQSGDNNFLSELMGIPQTDLNKTKEEIKITDLTEKALIQSYYGMLLDVVSTQKEAAEITGEAASTITNRKKKYKIGQEPYPYTLKAFKRNES